MSINSTLLQNQLIAEQSVKDYLFKRQSNCSFVSLRRAENKAIDSLSYLYIYKTKDEDRRQKILEYITIALNTFDPFKSDSFTYWCSLYIKSGKRMTATQKKDRQYQTYTEDINIYSLSSFDSNRKISIEQKCMIQQALASLSEKEFNILKVFLATDSYPEMAAILKVSKQRAHELTKNIINKIKL